MVSEALVREVRKGVYELPKTFKKGMRVPGRLYMSRQLLLQLEDAVLRQVANVACLPGIQKYSIAMPDAHQGYGFPIGGVAAFSVDEGVISPGGIGYDINCVAEGTHVLLASGEWKRVEELRPGEAVATPSGPAKILAVAERKARGLVVLVTAQGRKLVLTPEHPVLTSAGLRCAGNLLPGMQVACCLLLSAHNNIIEYEYDYIINIEYIDCETRVYDLVLEHTHLFFAEGITVHNCGVRLLRTDLRLEDVQPKLKELLRTLFENIPSGVGSEGKLRLSVQELDQVAREGVYWAIFRGYGWADDPERIEEGGCMEGADPSKVSARAKERGRAQLGTLGSGNHFLEVGVVEEIYDPTTAKVFGIEEPGQVVVWIHTGSRGYGHQICDDYLQVLRHYIKRHGYPIEDWELVYAYFHDKEAQDYFKAMKCAANFAWTNRQLITHWVRESFKKVFRKSADELGLEIVYDVAHNIAKIERHEVDGKKMELIVHRKGATRAFIAEMPGVPKKYLATGHPVLVPGDMGRASYILVGTEQASECWFTAPHGAGRVMSRAEAKRRYRAREILQQLESRGILVMAESMGTVVEEVSYAYKDVSLVVEAAELAGIARKVAKTRPLGVVKG
ncbi:MAG: hypothetical protein GXO42_02395 [bacterium]|nr:hypothetical protein [bacterium]